MTNETSLPTLQRRLQSRAHMPSEEEMKHILLTATLTLAACGPHVDPCRPWPTCNPALEYCRCVEMDRSDRPLVHDDAPDHSGDDGGNGAGSASSDAVSDDSNGDGSDE